MWNLILEGLFSDLGSDVHGREPEHAVKIRLKRMCAKSVERLFSLNHVGGERVVTAPAPIAQAHKLTQKEESQKVIR